MPAWSRLDSTTRAWWRLVGRRVDLNGQHRWLQAPVSSGPDVADGWILGEAERLGATVPAPDPEAGLLPDLAALDGSGFRALDVHPAIHDFYARTAAWRMEVWSQWSTLFAPPGAAISRLFGQRLQQLALPVRPLDVAHGMVSRVIPLVDPEGAQLAAGWLRTLRSTGTYVFSGCYAVRALPGQQSPSVHVSFPLEEGNVQVFLKPSCGPDRSLLLRSGPGRFGSPGTYVLARHGGALYAARVPLHETFHLYVDDEGVLRTDHILRLWSAQAVHLHYKLQPA